MWLDLSFSYILVAYMKLYSFCTIHFLVFLSLIFVVRLNIDKEKFVLTVIYLHSMFRANSKNIKELL